MTYKLSYICFLHQTTTVLAVVGVGVLLSYICFLHQTTTLRYVTRCKYCCLISVFYIKPQLVDGKLLRELVVLYLFSTSNHNVRQVPSVPLRLSYICFLHQTTTLLGLIPKDERLSYICFLHQTTTRWCSLFRNL